MIQKSKNSCPLIYKVLIILPLFGYFLFQCYVADASELKFAWDSPAGVDQSHIGGYYIYWGNESRNYVKRVHLGNVYEATIKELVEGNTYYFAVTCYYNLKPNLESDFSNELVKTIENTIDNPPIADTPINNPPIADAGADQTGSAGNIIFLNGTNSSDPDGDILVYSWTQLGGPNVIISDSGSSQPSLTLPVEGVEGQIFSFQLTVKDPNGLQSTDTCSVRIPENSFPPGDTDVSGTWGSIATKNQKGRPILFASFNLKNLGTENIESVMIRFYKSEDNNFDQSDYKIAEHIASDLKVGETVDVALRIENATIRSEDRLIAVIDPTDDLQETNEENNISISKAIQIRGGRKHRH